MKFVCLLHESELQVITELTKYNSTDTSMSDIRNDVKNKMAAIVWGLYTDGQWIVGMKQYYNILIYCNIYYSNTIPYGLKEISIYCTLQYIVIYCNILQCLLS